MAFDDDIFLRAFAKYLRGGAADAGTPRALWVYHAPEGVTDGTAHTSAAYTVLASYPGSPLQQNVPEPELSLQLMTTGPRLDAAAAMAQSLGYLAKLLDADGRPIRGVSIDGFRVKAVRNLRRPAQIGMDEKKRPLVAINFDVKAHATA